MARRTKYPIENYVGRRFGSRTVAGEAAKRGTNQVWTLDCDCGSRVDVLATYVMRGRANSCKSCSPAVQSGNLSHGWRGCGAVPPTSYSYFRWSARTRGIEWSITIDDVNDLFVRQGGRCALSGRPLIFKRHGRHKESSASIDRIDSSIGYLRGNIQLVTKEVNFAKQVLSVSDFISLCREIVCKADSDTVPT